MSRLWHLPERWAAGPKENYQENSFAYITGLSAKQSALSKHSNPNRTLSRGDWWGTCSFGAPLNPFCPLVSTGLALIGSDWLYKAQLWLFDYISFGHRTLQLCRYQNLRGLEMLVRAADYPSDVIVVFPETVCNAHRHGLRRSACEAQIRSSSPFAPRRLTPVHRCHMSLLRGREGLPEQALCRSQGNCFGILNETPPILGDLWAHLWLSADSGFRVCGLSSGPQGEQQIGSNPWSPQPKLISHTVLSVWVTYLKDRSLPRSAERFPA